MVIKFFLVVCFFLLLAFSPVFRCLLANLPKYLIHKFGDLYCFIRYKEYNIPPFFGMEIVAGNSQKPMGSGKTLYASNRIQNIYKRYNGKTIIDRKTKKRKTVKIFVLSNIELYDIDSHDFKSFEQIRQFIELKEEREKEFDESWYLYTLLDEASIMINSNKTQKLGSEGNPITIETLNDLCQVRHNQIQLLCFTSQQFSMVNVNVRRLSSYVKTSQLVDIPFLQKKRFLYIRTYIAKDLEEATTELMVKPISKKVIYLNNSKGWRYGNYDTHAMAGKILSKIDEGDYLTPEDFERTIINNDRKGFNIMSSSKKYRNKMKKMN